MKLPNFKDFMKEEKRNIAQGDTYEPQMYHEDEYNHPGMQNQMHEQMPIAKADGRVQVVPKDDPFKESKYENIQMPDAPIQGATSMAESLLNDDEVPEAVRRKFWYVFHKDNTLTFLDDERKKSKMLNFDIAKIDMLNSIPYYDYTFEEELGYTVLRNVFETKLDRALGFKGAGQKNERTVLQSQFSENRNINEQEDQNIKSGFFKRLLSRR